MFLHNLDLSDICEVYVTLFLWQKSGPVDLQGNDDADRRQLTAAAAADGWSVYCDNDVYDDVDVDEEMLCIFACESEGS